MGVITASVAVGGFVPYALPNKIVAATQGFYTNYLYNHWAEELINTYDVTKVLENILARDSNSKYRQLILMDKQGNTAGWTGESNDDYCGHILKKNLAVAGNRLDSKLVLDSMVSKYEQLTNIDFVEQIILSLEAGLMAGGDKQGALSIAIRVVNENYPPCDLRIDYSQGNIITDIKKLYSYYREENYQNFICSIPTMNDPQKAGYSKNK